MLCYAFHVTHFLFVTVSCRSLLKYPRNYGLISPVLLCFILFQRRDSLKSSASSVGWEADEFDGPHEDFSTEDEKRDRYLQCEDNDAFEIGK